MRFISNLCWVKKGVSKTPTKIKLDKKIDISSCIYLACPVKYTVRQSKEAHPKIH